MKQVHKAIDFIFVYILPFFLIYYIGLPGLTLAINLTLGLGSVLIIFSIIEPLIEMREMLFSFLSILLIGAAVAKAATPYMCGIVPGLFAALLVYYLLNTFVW